MAKKLYCTLSLTEALRRASSFTLSVVGILLAPAPLPAIGIPFTTMGHHFFSEIFSGAAGGVYMFAAPTVEIPRFTYRYQFPAL